MHYYTRIARCSHYTNPTDFEGWHYFEKQYLWHTFNISIVPDWYLIWIHYLIFFSFTAQFKNNFQNLKSLSECHLLLSRTRNCPFAKIFNCFKIQTSNNGKIDFQVISISHIFIHGGHLLLISTQTYFLDDNCLICIQGRFAEKNEIAHLYSH